MKRKNVNRQVISEAVSNICGKHIEEAAEFANAEDDGRQTQVQAEEPESARAAKPDKKGARRIWLKWTALAACACLAVIGITGFALFKKAHPYSVEIVRYSWNSDEQVPSMSLAPLPRWEERPIYSQYNTLEWNGVTYDSYSAALPAERIGELLGSGIAGGQDYYAEAEKDNGMRQIGVTVYTVTKISAECLLAVQYEGTDTWYAFANTSYRPETLGQFLKDLNLREEVKFDGTAHCSYTSSMGNHVNVEFTNVDADKIWEWLLSEVQAQNCYDQSKLHLMPREILGISVDIPLWGVENIALSVCEDGYIRTNIFATGKMFYIGEENTEGFMDYLYKECDVHETIYILEDEGTLGGWIDGLKDSLQSDSENNIKSSEAYEGDGAASPSVAPSSSDVRE